MSHNVWVCAVAGIGGLKNVAKRNVKPDQLRPVPRHNVNKETESNEDTEPRHCTNLLLAAGLFVRISIATTLILLYRWALHCPVAAIYTTVPLLRFYYCFAILTLIKILAGVCWHFLFFLMSAIWAGYD